MACVLTTSGGVYQWNLKELVPRKRFSATGNDKVLSSAVNGSGPALLIIVTDLRYRSGRFERKWDYLVFAGQRYAEKCQGSEGDGHNSCYVYFRMHVSSRTQMTRGHCYTQHPTEEVLLFNPTICGKTVS